MHVTAPHRKHAPEVSSWALHKADPGAVISLFSTFSHVGSSSCTSLQVLGTLRHIPASAKKANFLLRRKNNQAGCLPHCTSPEVEPSPTWASHVITKAPSLKTPMPVYEHAKEETVQKIVRCAKSLSPNCSLHSACQPTHGFLSYIKM